MSRQEKEQRKNRERKLQKRVHGTTNNRRKKEEHRRVEKGRRKE